MRKAALALSMLLLFPFLQAIFWPEFKFDQGNTGFTPGVSPQNGTMLWTFQTGSSVRSSPSVVEGVIYFGSSDGRFYALYAHNGTHIWNYSIGSKGVGDVTSSPLVADGVVYFGSKNGRVYALNATTGAHIWNYTTGASVVSSPTLADGILYIGSRDKRLYALNATTGAHIWNYTTGGSISASPAYLQGLVFIGSSDKKIYALNATTGALLWSFTTRGEVRAGCCMAKDGVVYAGSFDKFVYALNATTGAQMWSYRTGGKVESLPSEAFGRIYFGSQDGFVYALDKTTGLPVWAYDTGQFVRESYPAVASDGRLIIGSGSNPILGLNATSGELLWSVITGAAISNCLAWFGSDDGKMYAISGCAYGGGGFLNDSQLNIFDETDAMSKTTGEQVFFYANYTLLNGTTIDGNGTCRISFFDGLAWTAPANMTYNTSSAPYYYNRSFSIPGTFEWNVSCDGLGAEPKFAKDNYTILAPLPANATTGKANYSGCTTVYYRMRLYNASDELVNESFDIRVVDSIAVTRQSLHDIYPNNGTGVYLGNYSIGPTAEDGPWLIRAAIQGATKGMGIFEVRR